MEEEIEIYCRSKEEGSKEILNKLEAKKKIIELFETKQIKKVEIIYKKEPTHGECVSSKNSTHLN